MFAGFSRGSAKTAILDIIHKIMLINNLRFFQLNIELFGKAFAIRAVKKNFSILFLFPKSESL